MPVIKTVKTVSGVMGFILYLVMRWLLFLSRLAFICNLFFVLSASLQVYDWSQSSEVNSTILIIGYFLSLILNPVTNLIYLLLAIMRKKIAEAVPLWLMIANIVFLVIQLLFIIHLTASNNQVP